MPKQRLDKTHWSEVAEEWIAWAQPDSRDAFWAYRQAFANFVGQGTGQALEVGCGEGRVARLLKTLGYRVSAVDTVAELLRAAEQTDSADDYLLANAAALPFADASFDLVVAYNLLMSVDNLDATVAELRRVLRPDGRLVVSVTHPLISCGHFANTEGDAPLVLQDDYFARQRFEAIEKRDTLQMHFAGWTQPMEAFSIALEKAGLAIVALREPRPEITPGFEHLQRWLRLPLFLWLQARPLIRTEKTASL